MTTLAATQTIAGLPAASEFTLTTKFPTNNGGSDESVSGQQAVNLAQLNLPGDENTLWVSSNPAFGSDTTGTGTVNNPFATIGNAMDNIGSGATIIIEGGWQSTYSEVSLSILKNASIYSLGQETQIVNDSPIVLDPSFENAVASRNSFNNIHIYNQIIFDQSSYILAVNSEFIFVNCGFQFDLTFIGQTSGLGSSYVQIKDSIIDNDSIVFKTLSGFNFIKDSIVTSEIKIDGSATDAFVTTQNFINSVFDGDIILNSGGGAGVALYITGCKTNGDIILEDADCTVYYDNISYPIAPFTIVNNFGGQVIPLTNPEQTGITINVTSTSANLEAKNTYIANNASLVTLTLPATASIGDTFIIIGAGAGGWSIAQNSSQSIVTPSGTTTTGVGGSLSSAAATDCVYITCISTDTAFTAYSIQSNGLIGV